MPFILKRTLVRGTYFIGRNFRGEKFWRISRIKFAKLNPHDFFRHTEFAKLNAGDFFRHTEFAKLNPRAMLFFRVQGKQMP